ncbi:MAG TPA: hypothetical protein VK891_10610 [Euzebyales bacterium]|nr:hypothetical protein [Euzebyales bacterium]
MAVHQCPRCELRFRTESEYNDHLRYEHNVDPTRLEPFPYRPTREQKPLYPDLVEEGSETTHRVLIVSNATLRAERLQDHLTARAKERDTRYLLVVPAVETDRAIQPDADFVTVGDRAHPREHTLTGRVLAQHRLQEALSRLRTAGLEIDGTVGDADPARAVAQALRDFRADEIVVSTLPRALSNWLAVDLPTELRRRFSVPVTVVTAA